eukprot:tig00022080_g23797.t1
MRGKYTLREVPDPTDNLTAEELAMPNPRPRRKLRLVVEKQVDNRLKRGNSGDAPPLGRELVCDEDIFICIQREHLESGHKGGTGVYNNAKQRYAIPRYLVRIYVKICPVCKLKNKRRQPDGILHPIKVIGFWDRAIVDFFEMPKAWGPCPRMEWLPGWKWNESSGELERVWYWEQAVHVCRYEKKIPDPEFPGCYKTVFVTDVIPRFWAFVLAIKDHYTRFLILEACESKCAGEVADRLREKFAYFGACTILSCDNGSEFKNDIMKVLMAAYPNSSIAYGKPYTPEHQGSVERANRDSKPTLEAICYERRNQNAEDWANWALAIPDAMESHNSMKFANGHKMTPIEAMTGRRPSRRPLGIEPPSDPTRPYTEKDIEDLLGVANMEEVNRVCDDMAKYEEDIANALLQRAESPLLKDIPVFYVIDQFVRAFGNVQACARLAVYRDQMKACAEKQGAGPVIYSIGDRVAVLVKQLGMHVLLQARVPGIVTEVVDVRHGLYTIRTMAGFIDTPIQGAQLINMNLVGGMQTIWKTIEENRANNIMNGTVPLMTAFKSFCGQAPGLDVDPCKCRDGCLPEKCGCFTSGLVCCSSCQCSKYGCKNKRERIYPETASVGEKIIPRQRGATAESIVADNATADGPVDDKYGPIPSVDGIRRVTRRLSSCEF